MTNLAWSFTFQTFFSGFVWNQASSETQGFKEGGGGKGKGETGSEKMKKRRGGEVSPFPSPPPPPLSSGFPRMGIKKSWFNLSRQIPQPVAWTPAKQSGKIIFPTLASWFFQNKTFDVGSQNLKKIFDSLRTKHDRITPELNTVKFSTWHQTFDWSRATRC